MAPEACAFSAPGKALLAGGFLILDREYTGLVFALNARMHVHVQTVPTSSGVVLQEIIVRSPQFRNAVWRYGYHTTSDGDAITVTQLRAAPNASVPPNPFVEAALSYALTYVWQLTKPVGFQPALVTILADDDYYSQKAGERSTSKDRFVDFNVPLEAAHKTGLGSSAALVTAVVAAIVGHFEPSARFSLDTPRGRHILHNLAQAAHCAAQGKVGSGFDVASAVFGSCVYRRFSPSIISDIGDAGSTGFGTRLRDVVEERNDFKWDSEIEKATIAIPKGLQLVMCDVDCGSKTPALVKSVLDWRKNHPAEADEIWQSLQKTNEQLAQELTKLAQTDSSDYTELAHILQKARTLIRRMTAASKTPIEPAAQTHLLDACTSIEGVVGGLTPGAGGYDAVALLIEDTPETLSRLQHFLKDYVFEVKDPGIESTGKVRLLGVRGEMQGLQAESPAIYTNWTSIEA